MMVVLLMAPKQAQKQNSDQMNPGGLATSVEVSIGVYENQARKYVSNRAESLPQYTCRRDLRQPTPRYQWYAPRHLSRLSP
jgi:hypothetical protein